MSDIVLKTYKKRNKALQRRISIEQDINKRLVNLLLQSHIQLSKGLLKDLIEHELKMLKYKYH